MRHARKNDLIKSIKGTKNHRAKATEEQVIEIRKMYSNQKMTKMTENDSITLGYFRFEPVGHFIKQITNV